MSIDIANETDFGVEQGVDEAELASVARYVLDEMGIHPMAELSVLLIDTAAMEQLHIQWMDEPGPTDVLSFPANGAKPKRGAANIGDIAISPQTARRNARRYARSAPAELRILILHGMLHLAGFDHETDHGEMDRKERRLRGQLGVATR